MTSLAFTISGPPRPKGRPRVTRQGHAYTPDETRRYELHARTCALAARMKARWDPFTLGATYRVRLAVVLPNRRRIDLDNVSKACLDAMIGQAFQDDSQVAELHVYRSYDSESPRVDVVVTRIEATPDAKT